MAQPLYSPTLPRKLLIVPRGHVFRCQRTWAAPKHLTVTRQSLKSSLSNRCANTPMCKHTGPRGPGARSRRPSTGFVARTTGFMQKCAEQITLEFISSALLVKISPNPRQGEAGAWKSLRPWISHSTNSPLDVLESNLRQRTFLRESGLGHAHQIFLLSS